MLNTEQIAPAETIQVNSGGVLAYSTLPVFLVTAEAEVTRNFLVRWQGALLGPGLSHMALHRKEAPSVYPEIIDGSGDVRAIETGALLCGGPHGADSYWHWLIDYVPRLWVLEQRGIKAPLIVNADLTQVQKDTLDIYAPDRELILKGDERLHVKKLYAPSFLTQTGIARREVPRFLRRAWRHVDSLGHEKVYVSRVGIPGRAIPNEIEIEDEYRNKGFHIFRPHECAFWEQVATMMSAREIVGPHGGGLANCVFAPEGARVTEIVTNGTKPHHLTLATVCGQKYERLEWFR